MFNQNLLTINILGSLVFTLRHFLSNYTVSMIGWQVDDDDDDK
jgi:hypothetical protein